MTAPATSIACGCRCHVNPGGGCDPAHDTGSSGVPGQPSCVPHALDPSTVPEQLEAAVFHDVDALLVDVEFLAEHWADLAEHRRAGSPRPWRQALLDPDQRARMLARDREERAERDPDAPGFTAAPLHVDVLDVIVDAWTALDELAHLVSPDWRNTTPGGALTGAAAETRAPLTTSDITRELDVIRTWLPAAAPGIPARRLNAAGRHLHTAAAETRRALGIIRAGQLLTGALCPWCLGVTPKHPEGGQTTMRVEELPASRLRGLDAVPAVVCWNSLCEPPDEYVGTKLRGRPAWPIHEWDWLAPQLLVAEPKRSQPQPPPPRPAGFHDVPVLPIERFAGVGTSRTAPDAHRADTAVDDLIGRDAAYSPSTLVVFVGGPFARQTRKFTRLADELPVTIPRPPATGRPQLGGLTDGRDTIGTYHHAIVNDQAAYVWSTA